MRPEKWQQINDLYFAALERDGLARAAFLEEACANDGDLRREVESLLESNEDAGEFLSSSALAVAARALAMEQDRFLIGQKIGPYQVLSLLGAGGMGQIYLAEDTRLNRKVALKLLPHEFTRDPDRVRRFKQEARAASSLNHPNILTIFEIGEHEEIHFIVTEFIDGKTLRQRLSGASLKLTELLDILIQSASALAAAHEAGIVHRDIKPENIMVRRDGYVKLLDFGIAKLTEQFLTGEMTRSESLADASAPLVTDPGKVMGTARYISPDHLLGLELDGRSDIFSLGVVLYEMVAGRAPFEGATTGAVMAAILNHEPLPLMRYSRAVPAELERIVEKAIQKDRELRYQVIKDFMIDLKNLKLELEVDARLKRAHPMPARNERRSGDDDAPPPTEELTDDAAQPGATSGRLEPVGGAVPLDSRFYIERSTDREFHEAIERQDSLVLVKGPRQVGKTSLLARGLHQARERGARVVLIDFQSLGQEYFASSEKLILSLAETLADQLDIDASPSRMWNSFMSPGINFERFLRREVLAKIDAQIVWGLDEVDRLFSCEFGSDIFGLFRSWYNKRALDPEGPWKRLTQVIAYATEAHLFITDLNQSPFNVGTRMSLEDFNYEQVAQLNERHGSPLRDRAEIARYVRLVGGHPYLVRRGLHEMVARGWTLPLLEARADQDEGPFGDHLRRVLLSLSQDAALREVVQDVLQGKPSANTDSFYRLRSAGLMAGESARDLRPRCQLYANYLEKHLL
ncbi:MAG: serine/threonine-protein kinase [Blastocatellia bacterium]|nr:serine/threonine-protein kinase [Blastocatellia bacterium]